MDPNACLQRINDGDTVSERRDACKDLFNWIKSGGFTPDWDRFPRGTKIYRLFRKRLPL